MRMLSGEYSRKFYIVCAKIGLASSAVGWFLSVCTVELCIRENIGNRNKANKSIDSNYEYCIIWCVRVCVYVFRTHLFHAFCM